MFPSHACSGDNTFCGHLGTLVSLYLQNTTHTMPLVMLLDVHKLIECSLPVVVVLLSTLINAIISTNIGSYAADDKAQTRTTVVFYNLYIPHNKSRRVRDIVTSQLTFFRPWHILRVASIGEPITISKATSTVHFGTGNEMLTLHMLHDYCRQHRDKNVIYLHSKGSYHPGPVNRRFRDFATYGALSEECANLPRECNVCASRMSPVPHPHLPGNMWSARCEYVAKLMDPLEFETVMQKFKLEKFPSYCTGAQRWAAEHWILSHPAAVPCDLYANSSYTRGYSSLPVGKFTKDLKRAPRFDLPVYRMNPYCPGVGITLRERLHEYCTLYNMSIPPPSWWGWRLFHKEVRPTYT